ncbi:MAG: excisionase family DNA-binding protein [candidate division Zixibacteria bacterium]|nr:excisionase family DNA-binding protein [candidate division Zixibacteria bacterium]
MAKDYFTTTEAARLLSVSSDTVLKWVRAGKISSYRTPGGHSRIPRDAVATMLPVAGSNGATVLPQLTEPEYQYCWNFYASEGKIGDDCRNCVAYKSRAHRCYEMRDIPEQFGTLKLHCHASCTSCEYYKLMQGRGTSTLIVSRNRRLADTLQDEANDRDLILRFASSEYECGAIIDKFRPDYVVVDCSFGASRTRDICRHLSSDERIPFTRIFLTSRNADIRDCCDGEIFGWIKKPFTFTQLKDCLSHRRAAVEQ